MNTYLVDEAVLAQFADALIKEKYSNDSPKNYDHLKKELMKKTDHQITKAIIGSLTAEQGEELGKLLDDDTTSPDDFDKFFEKYNLNLNDIIKDAMLEVKDGFEKGDIK